MDVKAVLRIAFSNLTLGGVGPERARISSITPAFREKIKELLISRVTVKVTHFNRKKFEGFISREDAKHQIFQALGLELSMHHGTSFRRDEDDGQLYITFRLNQEINKDDLQHREFCYLKTSKAGKDDMISGEVVYPLMDDNRTIKSTHKELPKLPTDPIKNSYIKNEN